MGRKVHWAQRFSRIVVDGGAAGPEGLLICLMLLGKSAQTRMHEAAEKGDPGIVDADPGYEPLGVRAFARIGGVK
jgi:hypothetical protein